MRLGGYGLDVITRLLFCVFVAVSSLEAKRPNIVFAFADDWGRNASAYAEADGRGSMNDVISTPNFDRVAAEGVLFLNCFVTAPSCTPCRSSLLSGQYFWRTGRGAILQGAVWDESIPSYPLLLDEAGYHIGETYKVWSPGTPRDAPYGAGKFAYEKAGQSFNGFSQRVSKLVAGGKGIEEAKAELLMEVERNFGAFLGARDGDEPFCYWFGPTNVHRKWVKGSGKALWGIDPDMLKGKLPKFLPDVHEVRQDLADYLGEAQAFDAALGVLLRELEEAGELENTMVVVSGDHGAPGFPNGKCNLYDFGTAVPLAVRWPRHGKVGRVLKDLVNITDLAPTFLEAAGEEIPAVMTGRSLVNVLDSDSEDPDPLRKRVVTGRERHVAKVRPGGVGYPQRAIRTYEHLYIVNFKPERYPMGDPFKITDDSAPAAKVLEGNTFVTLGDLDASPTKAWIVGHRNEPEWRPFYEIMAGKRPAEELYAIGDDPDQMNNVAADPKYMAIKAELRRQLFQELKASGDPRAEEGECVFDKPPFVGEWKR